MTPPLRVALVIGSLDIGGAETQVAGLARWMHQQEVEVDVLVLRRQGPLLVGLEAAGVSVRDLKLRLRDDRGRLRVWMLLTAPVRMLAIAAFLRRQRYDVVHAFLFSCYATFVPLAWLAGVPVRIAARRGLHDALPSRWLVGPLTRLSTRLATAVVANADVVAADAHRTEAVPLHKLHVIPNAVDLPTEQADPSVQPPVALMISNLIHYKGHLDLVAAVDRIPSPPVVRCIGEGPMRDELDADIRARGLGGTVILEGAVNAARRQFEAVQMALLTSHTEGMPNTVLEAMAAGLPVIATDVGGCRELVEDGVTGWLVPPHRPDLLAEAIASLAADPAFRVRAGAAARQRAACYSWARCAQAHLSLYRRLAGSRGSTR